MSAETKERLAADVLVAALVWWRQHRPEGWTEEEHIRTPAVNAGYTGSARALAFAIAKLRQRQLTESKP